MPPRTRRTHLDDRFMAFVDKETGLVHADSPCWIWIGQCDKEGYGRVKWNNVDRLSHVVAYEVERGPVPKGLELDHLCNRTSCCNPVHLEVVTHAENVRRREERRRARVRAKRELVLDDLAYREQREKQRTDAEASRAFARTGTPTNPVGDDNRMMVENIPFCPHQPTDRQRAFLLDFGREALFGGAVGGGKSDALLMAALQFISVPQYAALIMRRTYTDLSKPGALLDRAELWFKGTGARYSTQKHTWTFPSGGRIVFGYCEHHADILQYQSAEFQYIAIDEVTEWPEERTYQFLFSRLRRPRDPANILSRVPVRMRCGTNPVGPGMKWVRGRFIVRGPAEMRGYYPSLLEDNPYIDAEEYEHFLAQLEPYERIRLRFGDWYASPPGSMFRREWFYGDETKDIPCRVVPARDPDPRWDVIRYWRYPNVPTKANVEPDRLVGILAARHTESGTFMVIDVQRCEDTAEAAEELMRDIALAEPDVPVRVEEKPGESGKALMRHLRNKVFPAFADLRKAPGTGDLLIRAEPFSAEAERGNILLVDGPWLERFVEEAELFPDALHANQVHALTGACAYLDRRARALTGGATPQGTTQANPWTDMKVSSLST